MATTMHPAHRGLPQRAAEVIQRAGAAACGVAPEDTSWRSMNYLRPWVKQRRVVIVALLAIALVVGHIAVLAALDELSNFYMWIWHDVFRLDRPFTHFMRDNLWYYIVPAVAVAGTVVYKLVPRVLYLNALLVIVVIGFLGFLAGHVYW